MNMNDRRRINGPSGGTIAPIFEQYAETDLSSSSTKLSRDRPPNVLRKMFLKTGVTPSASGSAYLEYEPSQNQLGKSITFQSTSGLKLSCTVHGPRPLPRSAPFSPHLVLAAHVKYAPFASQHRRGYVRDHAERDLAVHLESALRGVIIGDRWPKSGVDVVITVLEGEEDVQKSLDGGGQSNSTGPWGLMTVLSACITVASAAIADAGIDCVDIVSGGVAAIVRDADGSEGSGEAVVILDPAPQEHSEVVAACVVGYLPTRDEITNIWIRGDMTEDVTAGALSSYETLSENAVQAAKGAHRVLSAALRESLSLKLNS